MGPSGRGGGWCGRPRPAVLLSAVLSAVLPVLLPATSIHAAAPQPAAEAAAAFLPLDCAAEQTGGFHDYPDDDESYQPALFNATPFRLEENVVFMQNLPETSGVDLYVSLTAGEDPVTTELECRQLRGIDGSPGFSCVNIPPSEMLLINAENLRFTRTAVGGWTFAGATEVHSGDSIFVEYGTCAAPDPQPGSGG